MMHIGPIWEGQKKGTAQVVFVSWSQCGALFIKNIQILKKHSEQRPTIESNSIQTPPLQGILKFERQKIGLEGPITDFYSS